MNKLPLCSFVNGHGLATCAATDMACHTIQSQVNYMLFHSAVPTRQLIPFFLLPVVLLTLVEDTQLQCMKEKRFKTIELVMNATTILSLSFLLN